MIDPSPFALRRRADELKLAGVREIGHNSDTAALLLFYATECGLKSLYMLQNNLKNTKEARGRAKSARSYLHDICSLADALKIPRSAYAPHPPFKLARTNVQIHVVHLHEAWRYGERIEATTAVCAWLCRILDWLGKNR